MLFLPYCSFSLLIMVVKHLLDIALLALQEAYTFASDTMFGEKCLKLFCTHSADMTLYFFPLRIIKYLRRYHPDLERFGRLTLFADIHKKDPTLRLFLHPVVQQFAHLLAGITAG